MMKIWIHVNNVQEGPFLFDELPLNRMNGDTPVWYEGLEDWTLAKDAPLTAPLFDCEQPNISPQSTNPCADNPQEPFQQPNGQNNNWQQPYYGPQGQAGQQFGPQGQPMQQFGPQGQPWQQYGPQGQPMQQYGPQGQQRPMQWQDRMPRYPMYQQRPYTEKCPPTYIVWSILITVLCCNPIGIIPFILGLQTKSKFSNGDRTGALRMSNTTEWWIIIAFVSGLLLVPFVLLI